MQSTSTARGMILLMKRSAVVRPCTWGKWLVPQECGLQAFEDRHPCTHRDFAIERLNPDLTLQHFSYDSRVALFARKNLERVLSLEQCRSYRSISSRYRCRRPALRLAVVPGRVEGTLASGAVLYSGEDVPPGK
jgi:hypothetical protein